MKKNIVFAILAVLLASLSESLNTVLSKIALLSLSPLIYNCLRFLVASLIITPFLLKERRPLPRPSLSVLALCSIFTLNTIFFTYGVKLIPATLTSLLLTTIPLLTSILLYLLLRERVSVKSLMGIILGGIGTLVIILLPGLGQVSIPNGTILGSLLIGASILTFVIYSILSPPFQKRYSSLYLTAVFCYLTTLVTAILALPDFLHPRWWSATTSATWISTISAGLTIALFSLFYQYSIQYGSPLLASLSMYLTPLLTLGIAAFLLREYLTPDLLFGALFIFAGAYLVTTAAKVKGQKDLAPD
jgi:drug/metabolite transporter (DMT)-like permease